MHSAAATCPAGSERSTSKASRAPTSTSPRSTRRVPSITSGGKCDRFASVCFLTLPPSRYERRRSVLEYSRSPTLRVVVTTCIAPLGRGRRPILASYRIHQTESSDHTIHQRKGRTPPPQHESPPLHRLTTQELRPRGAPRGRARCPRVRSAR